MNNIIILDFYCLKTIKFRETVKPVLCDVLKDK